MQCNSCLTICVNSDAFKDHIKRKHRDYVICAKCTQSFEVCQATAIQQHGKQCSGADVIQSVLGRRKWMLMVAKERQRRVRINKLNNQKIQKLIDICVIGQKLTSPKIQNLVNKQIPQIQRYYNKKLKKITPQEFGQLAIAEQLSDNPAIQQMTE